MNSTMDSNLQTSFIPKKPLIPGSGKQHRTTNVFSIVASIIFITAIAICLGVFAYKIYLEKSVETSKNNLEKELATFEPSLISKLSRLDTRIESAKILMNQHVALSGFFDYLSRVTLQNVRFTSFTYSQKDRGGSLALVGVSKSFAAIASQSSEMMNAENQKYLQNPAFSNFNLDDKGNVGFSVAGSVNPSVFLYRNTLNMSSSTTNQ